MVHYPYERKGPERSVCPPGPRASFPTSPPSAPHHTHLPGEFRSQPLRLCQPAR